MKHTFKNHPAFVMAAALFMVAFMGAAMAALTSATSADARRTFDILRQAQLEQMLLAGTSEAMVHLRDKTPVQADSWSVELPPELTMNDAKLQTTIGSVETDGQVNCIITARFEGQTARQSVRLQKTDTAWKLVSAHLGDE